jgi:hypothetical protein
MIRIIFVILGLLMSTSAWTLDIRFGPEFTFTRFNGDQVQESREQVFKWAWRHLVHNQKAAAKFRTVELPNDSTRFFSPNGWDFTISQDRDVVEVQMKPMTVEMFEHFASDIQDAVFVSAANTNHFPAMFLGGGHINIDAAELLKNPLLLRNLLVDFYNHNELFMGAFGYDTNNSIPWNLKERDKEIAAVIARFDAGAYDRDVKNFVEDLSLAVRSNVDRFYHYWKIDFRPTKFYAVNLESVLAFDRLEIRAVRPQLSIDMWNRQIRLLRDRIRYLETLNKPIPIEMKVPLLPIEDPKQFVMTPPVDAALALRAFYEYVTESGQRWQDHRDYLWPDWINSGALERFEKSEWFQKNESGRSRADRDCESALSA